MLSPLKIVSDSSTLYSRCCRYWKLNIRQLSIADLLSIKMSSNFNNSQVIISSLMSIPFFSVKLFFQQIYTDYANYAYFDKSSHLNHLIFHQGNKHIYTVYIISGPLTWSS